MIHNFDGKNSKGIDIANATGSVVYAGNGLRGYGNMLIVKHSDDYLTAYAHNRALLVKEGQTCSKVSRSPKWVTPTAIARCCTSKYVIWAAQRPGALSSFCRDKGGTHEEFR